MSHLTDDRQDLLKQIRKRLSEEELYLLDRQKFQFCLSPHYTICLISLVLDPVAKRFSGTVNFGKNEDVRSIFNLDE